MANEPNGVTFDGLHSYTDFGLWISKQPNLGSPKPKLNLVDVPGMDGYLDMTEANSGEVKYSNRPISFVFSAKVNDADRPEFEERINAALHGKNIQQIIIDNDPLWYYTGRATVVFSEVKAWKLKCTVSVDAYPYAMKIAETVVDLNDPNALVELRSINLGGDDVSKNMIATDLRYGTQEFPTGNFAMVGLSDVIVNWPTTAVHTNNRILQFVDADEHVYTTTISSSVFNRGTIRIPVSDLAAANVDITKIYRVFVLGINGAWVTREQMAYHYVVANSRKSVVPSIVLTLGSGSSETNVYIVVDGRQYTITENQSLYEDIVLGHGDHDIYVPLQDATISSLVMRFREGKI